MHCEEVPLALLAQEVGTPTFVYSASAMQQAARTLKAALPQSGDPLIAFAVKANPNVAFFSVFGIILSACYALWLYARVIYGKLEKPGLQGILDLDLREKIILAPLVVLTIYYGVHPAPILDVFAPSTEALMTGMKAALANTQTAAATLPLPR